jgi:hypothetical protein
VALPLHHTPISLVQLRKSYLSLNVAFPSDVGCGLHRDIIQVMSQVAMMHP